ncbi:uncharacterized protein EV154DRAFT_528247 [Mucor mucedo]|uniref:uncharacterized protein n=1 Tax=Mucor mucedo TaxID=29922 RepID=UPI0022202E59|nr:uncharacterized protein EV154DRAFT_528247 [Mucor mucedo]KAI7873344.1 hypothetical protein EV154DRAFT_528247 [Mucor mucedo]
MIGSHVPSEITSLILGYVQRDSDIKTCRLVCSDWNSKICSIYYKHGISVTLHNEDTCSELEDQLAKLPKLASRIHRVSVANPVFRAVNPYTLISVLNMCTALEKLNFLTHDKTSSYLLLIFQKGHLSCIKEIRVDGINTTSPVTRRLHSLVNLKNCDQITMLELSDITGYDSDGLPAVRHQTPDHPLPTPHFSCDGYPDLISYASKFPNLKVLKLLPSPDIHVLDITALMESSIICKLEALHISSNDLDLIVQKEPCDWPKDNECNTITELDICVKTISVSTLECIMTKFTHLQRLAIDQDLHLTDYQNSSFDKAETQVFMDQFTFYCNRIKNLEVFMVYETLDEDGDRVPRQISTQEGRLIDMEHESCFCYYKDNTSVGTGFFDDDDPVEEFHYYFDDDDEDTYAPDDDFFKTNTIEM